MVNHAVFCYITLITLFFYPLANSFFWNQWFPGALLRLCILPMNRSQHSNIVTMLPLVWDRMERKSINVHTEWGNEQPTQRILTTERHSIRQNRSIRTWQISTYAPWSREIGSWDRNQNRGTEEINRRLRRLDSFDLFQPHKIYQKKSTIW
jgi:hypothetical protein